MSSLRLCEESELRRGDIIGSGAFGTVYKVGVVRFAYFCYRVSSYLPKNSCLDTEHRPGSDETGFNISCNDPHQADALKLSYMDARDNYHGLPITDYHKFDTELVNK